MLRPTMATFRPNSSDSSRICWILWIEELKQEISSRRSARLKTSSSRGLTASYD